MDRRDFLKTGLAASAAIGLAPSLKGWVPQHNWHKKQEEAVEEVTVKVCPYCQSEISIKATKCPHCTSDVE